MSGPGDRARAQVLVAVPQAEAFAIFTEDIDRWWRRGRRFRASDGERSVIAIEPGVGGRLLERADGPGGAQIYQTGVVVRWEPPSALAIAWRGVNLGPDEGTLVEVSFDARPGGTLVTVTHSGWSKLRADHPVRHGQDTAAFLRTLGLWWGDLLSSLRTVASER